MNIPFRNEIDDLFRNGRSVWLKISAGAFVGLIVAIYARYRSYQEGDVDIDLWFDIGMALFTIGIGALGVIILLLKDVVSKRLNSGQRVSFLLRVYYGMGVISILVSITTIVLLTIVITLMYALFSS